MREGYKADALPVRPAAAISGAPSPRGGMFSLAQANPGELVEVPNLSLLPRLGRIAQLVEQLTLNQRVQGSSPCAPTKPLKRLADPQIFIPTRRRHPQGWGAPTARGRSLPFISSNR